MERTLPCHCGIYSPALCAPLCCLCEVSVLYLRVLWAVTFNTLWTTGASVQL